VLRSWQGSEIIIAFNIGPEQVSLRLPGTLTDFLTATGEAPQQQGGTVALPGYAIAILVL